jgi:hypothetical protein
MPIKIEAADAIFAAALAADDAGAALQAALPSTPPTPVDRMTLGLAAKRLLLQVRLLLAHQTFSLLNAHSTLCSASVSAAAPPFRRSHLPPANN